MLKTFSWSWKTKESFVKFNGYFEYEKPDVTISLRNEYTKDSLVIRTYRPLLLVRAIEGSL